MSVLTLITQDAALAKCELDRVRSTLKLEARASAGVAVFQDDQVVQRTFGAGSHEGLWEAPDAEIVVVASRTLGVGEDVESASLPLRFRHWLFVAVGELERPAVVREKLWNELPEFLQSTIKGPTWEEVAFARFLAELRSLGRMDDALIDAASVASSLQATAKALEQVSAASGVTNKPRFALVAANARLVAATRRGLSLGYVLLEGRAECARHQIAADAKDGHVLVRDHRRRRSVALSSSPGEGWVSLPDAATITVDRKLAITVK